MAEQCVFGYAIGNACRKYVDSIDPFSNVDPFTENILIHIGDGTGIQIESDVTSKCLCKSGLTGAGRCDLDARLKHPVASYYLAAEWIVFGTIERMSECGDQAPSAIFRQNAVGIQ